jgi:hypothetical protein
MLGDILRLTRQKFERLGVAYCRGFWPERVIMYFNDLVIV